MNVAPSYSFFPLGDSAITLDFGNNIDESINRQVIALFNHLKNNPVAGMTEAVPAYSSLTIYYDVVAARKKSKEQTAYDWMKQSLENLIKQNIEPGNFISEFVRIPVCYEKEFAPDLETIATVKKLTVDEIIRLHTTKKYRVFMLGFLPGFAYMGEVDEAIAMPRLAQPRQKVAAGSVGIAGKQTGIYPLDSPGGWQIIGRTPLKLFNASPSERSSSDKPRPTRSSGRGSAFKNSLSLLQPGDEVQFDSISRYEYENYQSRHS